MQSQEEEPSETQVALINDDQKDDAEAQPELEQFDEILAVQHWAMQTTAWKVLNVLIELVDEKQLQYMCKNGDLMFEVFASVIQLALWKPYSGPTYKDDGKDEETAMTQVKGYIMGFLLPSFVNKSLPFLSAELTIRYLELFDQAMDIEVHLRDSLEDKKQHMEKVQAMHQQLLDCKGVRFDTKLQPRYQKVFADFMRTFTALRSEKLKQGGFRILRLYLIQYHKQLIAPLGTPQEQESVMMGSQFLVNITDEILLGLEEYHESIREEAQLLLLCIARRFLPQLSLAQEQKDLVQMLKTSMSQGWPPALSGQLKVAAKLESEMLGYLFASATGFLSKLITIYMDEHFGRESILQFFQLLSASCPFLILNDYRLAKQGSALRRTELLETLAQQV